MPQPNDIDAGNLHQLADWLYPNLDLAALADLADSRRGLAGGRRNEANLRFQLGCNPDLFEGLSQEDAGGAARWVDQLKAKCELSLIRPENSLIQRFTSL